MFGFLIPTEIIESSKVFKLHSSTVGTACLLGKLIQTLQYYGLQSFQIALYSINFVAHIGAKINVHTYRQIAIE